MSSQIEELQQKADSALAFDNHSEAIRFYTEAIGLDDKNHILYCNRSSAYVKAHKFEEALKDAEQCLQLNSDFIKGYSQKGIALSYLKRYDEAVRAYEEGLKKDPDNEQLEADLEMVRKVKSTASTGSLAFLSDPQCMDYIMANPKARELLKDPDTAGLLKKMQQNPNDKSTLKEPKIQKLFKTLVGMESTTAENVTVKQKAEEIPISTTKEQIEAQEEKEKGNEAYKRKDFETALSHYNRASELDPTNMIYCTNRAAVYFEEKRWNECVAECEKAIEIGRENRADFKLIAKAYTRMADAKTQENDYEGAIRCYDRSLTENRNPDVIKKRQEAEKLLKERKRLDYINPELSDQERIKGNECFKKEDYKTAIKHYTEAIRRNPSDARNYSNRATCHMKYQDYRLAFDDCETGLKIDPNNLKCYVRKGQAAQALGDISEAKHAYARAIKLDRDNQEAIAGYIECSKKSANDPDEIMKRTAANPEVQKIFNDPTMGPILQKIQDDPMALREYMSDPEIAQKLQKLADFGMMSRR